MERPERVLAEVARVLRPTTGRFALTSWTSDGEFFSLVGQAVQAHADMGVPCHSALLSAGFAEPGFKKLPLVWTGDTPQVVLDALHRGTVRTPMLIEAQTPEIQQAIEQAILRGSERYRQRSGNIVIKWPALLTTARRP
jgi:hypothetical protein